MPLAPLCPECRRRGVWAGRGADSLDDFVCTTVGCPVEEYRERQVWSRLPEPDSDEPQAGR